MSPSATARRPGGDPRPIGVFDSGVGGLTVARALMDLLPDESILYLGDTARGPYGPRDLAQVRSWSAEIIDWLAGSGSKLTVAACNTATAALDAEGGARPGAPAPVIGVIAPAVDAAVQATRSGRIGVIGTVGTIASGAYDRAVAAAAPEVKLLSQACPRFVGLAESGRTADSSALAVAAEYLAPLVAAEVDTLILGCTHYPLLTGVISYVMGHGVTLISSAEETARRVFAMLIDSGGLAAHGRPRHRFVSTGDPESFAALATRFLGARAPQIEGASELVPGAAGAAG